MPETPLIDQQDYRQVDSVTHKVEKDVVKTLTRVNLKIMELKQRLGPDALLTITLSAHMPRHKELP